MLHIDFVVFMINFLTVHLRLLRICYCLYKNIVYCGKTEETSQQQTMIRKSFYATAIFHLPVALFRIFLLYVNGFHITSNMQS